MRYFLVVLGVLILAGAGQAAAAPSAISTVSAVLAGLADRVLAATNHELVEQTRLRATEDFKEGVKATEERRPANFKGR